MSYRREPESLDQGALSVRPVATGVLRQRGRDVSPLGRASPVEVLAQVLRGADAMSVARQVLDAAEGLSGLASWEAQDLVRTGLLGPARARSVAACVELARRWMEHLADDRPFARCPADVARLVRARLLGATQEHFFCVGLTSRHRVLCVQEVARGSLSQVDVHPRELFRPAVRAGAHALLLAHNHPSGDPQPSDADIAMTHRMMEVGRVVGIPVLDHVVVASAGFVSLAALGVLDEPRRAC